MQTTKIALKPIIIRRSTFIKDTSTTHELVSTVFHATFANGNHKCIRLDNWQLLGLRKEKTVLEIGEEVLSMSDCCLYFKDWSDVPTIGDFRKNYPTTSFVPQNQ